MSRYFESSTSDEKLQLWLVEMSEKAGKNSGEESLIAMSTMYVS